MYRVNGDVQSPSRKGELPGEYRIYSVRNGRPLTPVKCPTVFVSLISLIPVVVMASNWCDILVIC